MTDGLHCCSLLRTSRHSITSAQIVFSNLLGNYTCIFNEIVRAVKDPNSPNTRLTTDSVISACHTLHMFKGVDSAVIGLVRGQPGLGVGWESLATAVNWEAARNSVVSYSSYRYCGRGRLDREKNGNCCDLPTTAAALLTTAAGSRFLHTVNTNPFI